MHIVALKSQLAEMLPRLRPVGKSDGWTTRFVDPVTGKRWTRIHLGTDYHGGGQPVLVPDPTPTVADLLEIVSKSEDPAQIAASAWILAETEKEGGSREKLLMLAESAASEGDQARAALIVGWGRLTDSANLRPTLGKSPREVSSDHEYFKGIADRAKGLLHLTASDPLLRDPGVFEG
jgi:hypothetical protein